MQTMQTLTYDPKHTIAAALTALPMAVVTTAVLFLLMHKLISHDLIAPPEGDPHTIPEIIMQVDPTIEPHYEKPDRPKDETDPPPTPVMEPVVGKKPGIGIIPGGGIPEDDINIKISANSSNVPIAHLLAQPVYPRGAISRGLEGYVDVMFDVLASGATANATVVGAQPQGVFEQSALAAVARWKYQPVIDSEGNTQPFFGLTQRVRYEMQK